MSWYRRKLGEFVWAYRTDIPLGITTDYGTIRAKAGEWIVEAEDGSKRTMSDEAFQREYGLMKRKEASVDLR